MKSLLNSVVKKEFVYVAILSLLCGSVFAQSLSDAKKAIDAEQYQKAKSILKNLQTAQPTNVESGFLLGNVYLKSEEEDSAKVVYETGIALDQNNPLNYIGMGALALSQNDTTRARLQFEKAILLTKKKDLTTYLYIAKAYIGVNLPDKAISYLNNLLEQKKNQKEPEIYLALGDAYFLQLKNGDAVSAYDKALVLNKTLLRAYVAKGVIWKMALNYEASQKDLNDALLLDPTYGPAYRELAETYLRWANIDSKSYKVKVDQALGFYKKYLDNTDLSVESRMRYADFLILAKEYKALELEANTIAKMENRNARIYRYLGYAAYENGNFQASLDALESFFREASPKRIIAKDYYYLGKSQIKLAKDSLGILNLKKAVDLDSTNITVFNEVAKEQYADKKYDKAIQSYEYIVTKNPKATLYDRFYLGMSYFWAYNNHVFKKQSDSTFALDTMLLIKADTIFSQIIKLSPSTSIAYYYRGKIARFKELNPEEGKALPFFEKFVEVIGSNVDEIVKNKRQLAEIYVYFGANIVKKDKNKAIEFFNKVKELDPQNTLADQYLIALGVLNPPASVNNANKSNVVKPKK